MSSVNFDMTKASNYLKKKYEPAGMVIYNTRYAYSANVNKRFDWTGENIEAPVELSLGVGVGTGAQLPDAAVEHVAKLSFSDKNVYARARIARKLIKKAVGGESAFIDAQRHKWQRTQEGWAWNVERQIFNSLANGSLGTISGAPTAADPVFTCTISTATWKTANWHRGILVNVGSSSDVFEVTAITPSTRVVELTRQSGAHDPADTELIYMQNSNGTDLTSISAVTAATSGSLYGITVQHLWQSSQDTSGGGISIEKIDDRVLDIETNTGTAIDAIYTSVKQWKILKSTHEHLKTYNLSPANAPSSMKAKFGFTALEYASPAGGRMVPILYSRFIEDDRVYITSSPDTTLIHTHQPQWFDDDGTVFLRTPDNRDDYEARYGSYMEYYAVPARQGLIDGLS